MNTCIEPWNRYSRDDQLALERAHRSDQSEIELSNGLVNFGYAMQYDETGNVYRLRRNELETETLRKGQQRNQDASPSNETLSSVTDLTLQLCLDRSIPTDNTSIINGILQEGQVQNKKTQAACLVMDLNNFDPDNTVLLGLRCIKLYTRDSFLPKTVNRALRRWDFTKVKTLGPFCKVLYQQFDQYRTNIDSVKVYRGAYLRWYDIYDYKNAIGKERLRWLGFTSASKILSIAETFCRNTLLIIRLKKVYNDGRVLDISKISQFPEECEILFRHGVEFTVDRYKFKKSIKRYTFFLTAYI